MTSVIDIKDTTPNKRTVELLEDILKDAKAGNIRSVVILSMWENNASSTSWSIDSRTYKMPLLAGLAQAQWEYQTYIASLDDDSILCREFFRR